MYLGVQNVRNPLISRLSHLQIDALGTTTRTGHTHTHETPMPDLISKFSFKSFYMSRPHTFSCFCSCSRSPSLCLSFSFAPSLDLSVSFSFSASNSLSRACVLSLYLLFVPTLSITRACAYAVSLCRLLSLSFSLSLSLDFFLVRSFFLSCALSSTHTHSFALAPLLSNTQSPPSLPRLPPAFSRMFSPSSACVCSSSLYTRILSHAVGVDVYATCLFSLGT